MKHQVIFIIASILLTACTHQNKEQQPSAGYQPPAKFDYIDPALSQPDTAAAINPDTAGQQSQPFVDPATDHERWLSSQPRAFQKGYNAGYEDGHDDGAELNDEGDSYDPQTRLKGKQRRLFLKGYHDGYHDGYFDGRDEYHDEAEASEFEDDYY